MTKKKESIEAQLASLNEHELRRLLIENMTKQKLGLVWEHNAIERDKALNADVILPRLREDLSCRGTGQAGDPFKNLIIEGDNFDALRLLRTTHANKIRVIYIDPPYNTGNKDWVYNDDYVGKTDRWRHSQWLEFLYQRLTLARDLLTPDGVILVSINDGNRARLELLMDEVFPGMRIGSFVWKTRIGSQDASGLLSIDHEHVLVFGMEAFKFRGVQRDETKYSNKDEDERGDWGSQMLIQSKTSKQRPECYYHIRNPLNETWYLCDPDSAWRFSSITRPLKKKIRQSDPIEAMISNETILWPTKDKSVIYSSVDEIYQAIDAQTAPIQLRIYRQIDELKSEAQRDEKVSRLLSYIEPIENWVGRRIGYGRPRFKRFRDTLRRESMPVSSWLQSAGEEMSDMEDMDAISLSVGTTGEGTTALKRITGKNEFQYPKPPSLIIELLRQSMASGDFVLDFFAGSGTTAHAVLALNAEDGGNRRFILCSNTEATAKEPDKNLCRNVCAERVRRVISGNGDMEGLAGDFAYIELDKLDPADARLDATSEQSYQLLSLRSDLCARVMPEGAALIAATSNDYSIVFVPEVNAASIKALSALPQPRLAVYSSRPQTVAEKLESSGKEGNSYAIGDVIMAGQGGAA